MKRWLIAFLSASLIILFLSCKKELSCDTCATNNQKPQANAGTDQSTTLPKDSVMLDGSASTDPDGSIIAYKWIKIAGPASFNIVAPASLKTSVIALVEGVYQFELTVTDNGGLTAKDTLLVTVDNPGVNRPPVANAGADKTITAPANAVQLDGSAPTDPDNNIRDYSWTKIAGPLLANIDNNVAKTTMATNLVPGVYQFQLLVTDAGGLTAKDTVQITVEEDISVAACGSNRAQITAQLVPITTLPSVRGLEAVVAAGNKVVFTDGYEIVDIYDLSTGTWSTARLSERRSFISVVAAGIKVFFAGGETGDGTLPTKTVDIYDAVTNTWVKSALSLAGAGLLAGAVSSKVLFAGGEGGFTGGSAREATVDIFDINTNTWSTARWNGNKFAYSAVAANNKLYFAGHLSDPTKIEVYEPANNTWSVTSFGIESKEAFAAIGVNDEIYWAGGISTSTNTPSCKVEVRDVSTGASSIQYLSQATTYTFTQNGLGRIGYNAVLSNNKIVFYSPGNTARFDIYDLVSKTWAYSVVASVPKDARIVSANNIIYVAGGTVNNIPSNNVYKLEL